jgi:hypothetical protein
MTGYDDINKTWNGQNIEREITISTDPYRAGQLSVNEATFRRYMGGRPEVTFNESYFVSVRELMQSSKSRYRSIRYS